MIIIILISSFIMRKIHKKKKICTDAHYNRIKIQSAEMMGYITQVWQYSLIHTHGTFMMLTFQHQVSKLYALELNYRMLLHQLF